MTAESHAMTVPAEVGKPATRRRIAADATATKMRRHRARPHASHAIVRTLAEPVCSRDLVAAVRAAETDPAALPSYAAAIDAMATIPQHPDPVKHCKLSAADQPSERTMSGKSAGHAGRKTCPKLAPRFHARFPLPVGLGAIM